MFTEYWLSNNLLLIRKPLNSNLGIYKVFNLDGWTSLNRSCEIFTGFQNETDLNAHYLSVSKTWYIQHELYFTENILENHDN